jgi:hypothetical protein
MELVLSTERQRMIADLLWVCNTSEEVTVIVKTFGYEAESIRQLMVAASLDEVKETQLAERVLVDIMSK